MSVQTDDLSETKESESETERASPIANPKVRYGAILVAGLLVGILIGVGLSEFVLSGFLDGCSYCWH